MRLVFHGARGTVRTDWSDFALLRDNVQHYVEGGAPTKRFAAIHAIERAVDGSPTRIDAARLRGEVLGAWFALRRLNLGASAVSIRTRAIVTGCSGPPNVRGTILAANAGWPPAVQGRAEEHVVGVLRDFFREVLSLTSSSMDGDHVLVRLEGSELDRIGSAEIAS